MSWQLDGNKKADMVVKLHQETRSHHYRTLAHLSSEMIFLFPAQG